MAANIAGKAPQGRHRSILVAVAKHRPLLNQIIGYVQRLATCIAIGAGSAAIVKYRAVLFEPATWLPTMVGILGALAAIVLAVWVCIDGYARLPSPKSKIVSLVAAVAIVAPSILFVLAGLFGAMSAPAASTAPKPTPAHSTPAAPSAAAKPA